MANYLSSAAEVRKVLAESADGSGAEGYRPNVSGALRTAGEKPGEVQITASVDQMRQWLPDLENATLAAWSKMPIWCLKAYSDRRRYEDRPGLPYQTHVFPEAVDIVRAVQWWRLRIPEERKGLAVFESSFAPDGPMELTDPPQLLADAENARIEADPQAEIDAKRLRLQARERMSKRWESKGLTPSLNAKIDNAERKLRAQKADNKQKYQLGIGWVKTAEFSARQNEIRMRYG